MISRKQRPLMLSFFIILFLVIILVSFRQNYAGDRGSSVVVRGEQFSQVPPSNYFLSNDFCVIDINTEFNATLYLIHAFDVRQNLKYNNVSVYFSTATYAPPQLPQNFRFYVNDINVKLGSESFKLESSRNITQDDVSQREWAEYEDYTFNLDYHTPLVSIENFDLQVSSSLYNLDNSSNLIHLHDYNAHFTYQVIKLNSDNLDNLIIILSVISFILALMIVYNYRNSKYDELDQFYVKNRLIYHLAFFLIFTKLLIDDRLILGLFYLDIPKSAVVAIFFTIMNAAILSLFGFIILPYYFSFYQKRYEIAEEFALILNQSKKTNTALQSNEADHTNLTEIQLKELRGNYMKFSLVWNLLILFITLMIFIFSGIIMACIVYCVLNYFEFSAFNRFNAL